MKIDNNFYLLNLFKAKERFNENSYYFLFDNT